MTVFGIPHHLNNTRFLFANFSVNSSSISPPSLLYFDMIRIPIVLQTRPVIEIDGMRSIDVFYFGRSTWDLRNQMRVTEHPVSAGVASLPRNDATGPHWFWNAIQGTRTPSLNAEKAGTLGTTSTTISRQLQFRREFALLRLLSKFVTSFCCEWLAQNELCAAHGRSINVAIVSGLFFTSFPTRIETDLHKISAFSSANISDS